MRPEDCRKRRARLSEEVRQLMEVESLSNGTCCEERKARALACSSCPSKTQSGMCTEVDKFVTFMITIKDQSCPLDRWSDL